MEFSHAVPLNVVEISEHQTLMPTLPQVSSGERNPLPTTMVQPTWSFSSPTNPFNPAEIATLRVLGLDSDILATVINEGLREDLFEKIVSNAQLLSQIPSDERTGTLIDLWLAKVNYQIINEQRRRRAQDQAHGTFPRGNREATDALNHDTSFQFSKHQDKAKLSPELAAEYRKAIASVDLESLSPRFFSKRGPNDEHVSLNGVLKRKFEEEETMDREPRQYDPWALAAICDSVPSIDHWPNRITDAFVARDWKFGLSGGEVVLEIANGREEDLLPWFRENCSEKFIRNHIMEVRRKAQQTLRQSYDDERLLERRGVQAFWHANQRVSAREGNA